METCPLLVSAFFRPNAQPPVVASYWSWKAEFSVASWETTAAQAAAVAGLTEADTERERVVSSRGRAVAIWELLPLKVPELPVQLTALLVAVCPVPDASGTLVPFCWVSSHQPSGTPPPVRSCDCE